MLRYDLAPGSPAPEPGQAIVALSRRTGEPTGAWYAIVAVRAVAARRPRPCDRWALTLVRQDGEPPPDALQFSHYPKGMDVDAYWEARLTVPRETP